MTARFVKYLILLVPLVSSGCLTLVDEATIGEQQASADSMKVEVGKMVDKVNEMKQELAVLKDEVQAIKNSQADSDKATRNRLDEIDRSIKAMESANGRMRQEILDEITEKLKKLYAGQTGGKSSSKSGSGKTDVKKPVERGYEHIVKQGQTLSEIATAYNVTPAVIIKANNLQNPNSLRVGQKLFIPE